MANRYKVTLTQKEREQLTELTRSGKSTAAKFVHARALLLCDAGKFGEPWKVAEVATALGVSSRTIEHLKQRFVEEGVEAALARKPQSKPRAVNFDGEFDARLTARGLLWGLRAKAASTPSSTKRCLRCSIVRELTPKAAATSATFQASPNFPASHRSSARA